jgi:hypothetical protein
MHYLVKYDVIKYSFGEKGTEMCKCKLSIEAGKHYDVG